jgi:peroxiredoxin
VHRRSAIRPSFLAAATAVLITVAVIAFAHFGGMRPEPAPEVTYTLLDGRRVGTDDLRGKVVLVNFWATSCATCLRKMPQLASMHLALHHRGLETIAVAMRHDPPALVSHFAETRRLPFAVAIDNTGSIARGFGDVRLTPTTFVIDRRGDIAARIVGEPDFDALQRLVERLLAAPRSPA